MTEEVKSPSNANAENNIQTTPQGGSSSGEGNTNPSQHHNPTALEVI